MKRWLIVAVALAGCSAPTERDTEGNDLGRPVSVRDGEDKQVFANLVETHGRKRGVILLFHQAGSNMHEYDPIAPKLANLGWDCLKVDQRAGGEMWGHGNKTSALYKVKQTYDAAYHDMEAALKWAEGEDYDRILAWGSSYSASLVFRLAAEHKNVNAVLSFSPGEYFGDKGIVANWASRADVPCFIAGTAAEMTSEGYAIADARGELDAKSLDMQFGIPNGVHGSSTLRQDKNPKGNGEYWKRVNTFLESVNSGGKNFGG